MIAPTNEGQPDFQVGDLVYVTFVDPDNGESALWGTGAIVSLWQEPPTMRPLRIPVVQLLGGLRVPIKPEYLQRLTPAGGMPNPDWIARTAAAVHAQEGE